MGAALGPGRAGTGLGLGRGCLNNRSGGRLATAQRGGRRDVGVPSSSSSAPAQSAVPPPWAADFAAELPGLGYPQRRRLADGRGPARGPDASRSAAGAGAGAEYRGGRLDQRRHGRGVPFVVGVVSELLLEHAGSGARRFGAAPNCGSRRAGPASGGAASPGRAPVRGGTSSRRPDRGRCDEPVSALREAAPERGPLADNDMWARAPAASCASPREGLSSSSSRGMRRGGLAAVRRWAEDAGRAWPPMQEAQSRPSESPPNTTVIAA
jgi:hypothetical protein